MRRLALLTLCAAATLAACGGTAATPKSTDAFCSRLGDLRNQNPLADALTDQQAADQAAAILDDLVGLAPQQIKDDVRTFRRVVAQISDLDVSDAEAAQKAAQDLVTPEVISAAQSLATFAKDQCGFSDVFETDADNTPEATDPTPASSTP